MKAAGCCDGPRESAEAWLGLGQRECTRGAQVMVIEEAELSNLLPSSRFHSRWNIFPYSSGWWCWCTDVSNPT